MELGIMRLVSPRHPPKAFSPIDFTELGIVNFFSPLQPENAESPISVTEFGITISVRPVQPSYVYVFEYRLFVVNTVEKWLGFFLDTKNRALFNVFNFILNTEDSICKYKTVENHILWKRGVTSINLIQTLSST